MLMVWHKVIHDMVREGGRLLSIIPWRGSLKPNSHLSVCSQLIGKRRASYRTVGVLAAIYLSCAAALAEVEEVSPDFGGSNNSISTIFNGLEIDLFANSYDDLSEKDINNFHLDENIIPSTVWSLRGRFESHIPTEPGARFESIYSWSRTAADLWSGNNIYSPEDLLPLPPPQFQVASCGGSHAERKDLDYCSKDDAVRNKEADLASSSKSSSDDDNTVQNADSNDTSSGEVSSSSANIQSTSFSSMPAFISNSLSYSDLTLLDPCGSASASCAIIQIDPSETPVDSLAAASPTSPVLFPDITSPDITSPDVTSPDVTTHNPITHVDDPGLGSDLPLVTPQPLKPIPEASTWVMTITGFGIMVFVCRKKRRPRINAISIIDEV